MNISQPIAKAAIAGYSVLVGALLQNYFLGVEIHAVYSILGSLFAAVFVYYLVVYQQKLHKLNAHTKS
jgi:uncharacterized membrane protein